MRTVLTGPSLAPLSGPITGPITVVCPFPALNQQARQCTMEWRGARSGVRDPGLDTSTLAYY